MMSPKHYAFTGKYILFIIYLINILVFLLPRIFYLFQFFINKQIEFIFKISKYMAFHFVLLKLNI